MKGNQISGGTSKQNTAIIIYLGQRLIGEFHECIDLHKHQVQMFSVCALVSEMGFQDKPEYPQIPLQELQFNDILLSMEQYEMMREDMIMIVAKVLRKYVPQLKVHLESIPFKFGQDHSEFSHKRESVMSCK